MAWWIWLTLALMIIALRGTCVVRRAIRGSFDAIDRGRDWRHN